MKKLTKLFNFNSYSFSTRVICSLILFIVFFIFIKIALTSTKIENNSLNNEIDYITKTLLLTKEQIKIIGKSLGMQTELEMDLTKKIIEEYDKAAFFVLSSRFEGLPMVLLGLSKRLTSLVP